MELQWTVWESDICLGAGWVLVDAQEGMDVSLEMELGIVSLFAAAAYLASTDESG